LTRNPTVVPTVFVTASEAKAQVEDKFHIFCLVFDTDDLVKPRSSVQVVRRWHGICTDPVLRSVDNLEGLSCGIVLAVVVPELSSWLTV
jgi:hypothetical protein